MGKLTVQIIDSGRLIWERNEEGGIACSRYLVDGTQVRIIEALKEALVQSEAELLLLDVGDGVSDIGRTATQV
jgi:hypothetical protein